MPLIAHVYSRTYPLRNALRCTDHMAKTKGFGVHEFRQVCEFSSRAPGVELQQSPQSSGENFADPELKQVDRKSDFRKMLIHQRKAFERLRQTFQTGNGCRLIYDYFYVSSCADPDAVSKQNSKRGVFLCPLAKGVRVSDRRIRFRNRCAACFHLENKAALDEQNRSNI